MSRNSSNPLAFFVVAYAFFLSSIALAGYILKYLDLRIDIFNISFFILIIITILYVVFPVALPKQPTKVDILIIFVSLLASARFAIFFTSNYPVGNSVDLAHYYFAADWIRTNENIAFIDYRNEPGYYYLWHTWSQWLWYYGFEIAAAFISNIFNINVMKSMQILAGMSGFVSILCMGLIGTRVLEDWKGGVLTILQLASMPATYLLAFNGFLANTAALSIGLTLIYLSIDRIKPGRIPILFVLVAGGFLIHIHTMIFILGAIIIYKFISYSQTHKNDLSGYILAIGLGFIGAYILNSSVFNKILFEGSTNIITNTDFANPYVQFAGLENLFGSSVFLLIGIAGTYILYRLRLKTGLLPFVWSFAFLGAFILLFLSDKMHWTNRLSYFVVYPLAISCAAFYLKFYENKYVVLSNHKINFNTATVLIAAITLLIFIIYSEVPRTDLNPEIYDLAMKLSDIDSNATIAYIQYPKINANPNNFFISAYSRHRIAWPVKNPNNMTYETMKNISYTNEYVPEWHGDNFEYSSFRNFDNPEYLLVMFTEMNKIYAYYFIKINRSNVSCENVLSSLNTGDCSITMDFLKDENLMMISGFYEYESGSGRWSYNSSKLLIPTIEQKNGILKITSGAFRPEGLSEAKVDVYLNDIFIGNFIARNEFEQNIFKINESSILEPFSTVTFNTNMWIPNEWLKNGDRREIGIRLSQINYTSE